MELTWGEIIRIVLVGLGVYLLLPLLLALRDFLVWRGITQFLLNQKFRSEVAQYVFLRNKWNAQFAGEYRIDFEKEPTEYFIRDQIVSKDEWEEFDKRSERLSKSLKEKRLFLDRRRMLVKALLKHYRSEDFDPVSSMIKAEQRRLDAKREERS